MGSGNDSTKLHRPDGVQPDGQRQDRRLLLPVLHTLIHQQAAAEAEERAVFERVVAEAAARGEPAPSAPSARIPPTHATSGGCLRLAPWILCPTRELAQQVAHDAIDLVKHCCGLRVANVVGGMPLPTADRQAAERQPVVATPGACWICNADADQARQGAVPGSGRSRPHAGSGLLGRPGIELNQLTAQRKQTMMFSATFAPRIQQLAMRVMHDGGASVQKVTIDSPQEKHANIKQML